MLLPTVERTEISPSEHFFPVFMVLKQTDCTHFTNDGLNYLQGARSDKNSYNESSQEDGIKSPRACEDFSLQKHLIGHNV